MPICICKIYIRLVAAPELRRALAVERLAAMQQLVEHQNLSLTVGRGLPPAAVEHDQEVREVVQRVFEQLAEEPAQDALDPRHARHAQDAALALEPHAVLAHLAAQHEGPAHLMVAGELRLAGQLGIVQHALEDRPGRVGADLRREAPGRAHGRAASLGAGRCARHPQDRVWPFRSSVPRTRVTPPQSQSQR
jgi:hypothetical protein